jgi:hypothetical protein
MLIFGELIIYPFAACPEKKTKRKRVLPHCEMVTLFSQWRNSFATVC